jgi:acyl-coenzyme A thioesterase PaaI-like protein
MDAEDTPPTDNLAARIETATALRHLGHAIVGHEVPDEVFERITAFVDTILPGLRAGAPRSRPVDDMKRRLFDAPPPDGASMDHFPDCVVSGQANPMGIAIGCQRQADDAVARVTLGAAFEGAPGRAHGGVVAAIFDDVMGFVLSMEQTPAFTGSLTVRYLAPTPVREPLEFRARLDRREDRKLWLVGEAFAGELQVAAAEALFIAIPPERFGLARPA